MKMTTESESNGEASSRMAHIPAIVNNHLDGIQHRSDGGLYLVASSLTSRYWNGSLWFFDEVQKAPDVEKCSAGVELSTGANDFTLVNDKTLLLGTDSGSIQAWCLREEESDFKLISEHQGHDSYVSSICLNANNKRAVTASQDKSIKVWDMEEMACTATLTAHYSTVTSVACHPTEPDIMLSCGQDGRLVSWDTRKPKPASILDSSALGCQPTAVAWQPGKPDTFAVGGEDGSVALFTGQSGGGDPSHKLAVQTLREHTRFIHRLAFSPHNSDWLASASDDSQVVVVDFSSAENPKMWKSGAHKDFVRGLSWHPKNKENLVTCSWDFQVLSHTVTPEAACIVSTPERKPAPPAEDTMDTMSPSGDQLTV